MHAHCLLIYLCADRSWDLHYVISFLGYSSEQVVLQDGVELPSYRGDIINGPEFTEKARIPNPERLVQAYNQSAATMNLLRAFSTGGYAGLDRVTQWNLDFMERTAEGDKYQDVAQRVDESIQFMKVRFRACMVNLCIEIWSKLASYAGLRFRAKHG